MFETISVIVAVVVGSRFLRKSVPKIKGALFERKVAKRAKRLKLPGKVEVLRNSLFRTERGGTSQVDVSVITRYGVFDLECKNYRADIYGDIDQDYWKCRYPRFQDQSKNPFDFSKQEPKYTRTETLYNPFRQSRGHISTIANILSKKYPHIPYYSLAVFSDTAALRVLNSKDKVCSLRQLDRVIQRVGGEEVLTDRQIEDIANTLRANRVKGRHAKKSHVRALEDNKEIRKMMKYVNRGELEQKFLQEAEKKPIWSSKGDILPEETAVQPISANQPLSEILRSAQHQVAENTPTDQPRNNNRFSR